MITCMQVKMTSLTKPLSLSPGVTYNVVHWTSWPPPLFISGLSRREGRHQAEVQELRRRPMVGGCKSRFVALVSRDCQSQYNKLFNVLLIKSLALLNLITKNMNYHFCFISDLMRTV